MWEESTLEKAHRLSRIALESPCLTEADCTARLADHVAAARAFEVAAARIPLQEASGLKALAQLKEQHTLAAEAIRAALAISHGHAAVTSASSRKHIISGTAFTSSAAFVRSTAATAAAASSSTSAAGSTNLLVIQLVQLVQVFLIAPTAAFSSSHSAQGPTMSYAQLQSILQQLRDLAAQLSSTASSLQPVSLSLPAADEERVGQELRSKLAVAEELHQYLARLVAQGEGLSPSALHQFHQRFIRLQQSQFDIARAEIVVSSQLSRAQQQLTQQSKQITEKLGELMGMINEAAKQAQANESNAAASSANAAAAAAAAASSTAEAQLKQLAEDKRALEKQLATLQRQVTLEKTARAKAEKAVEKHEQRWQALNEKVAEKKKQQLAAAVAGASAATAAASGASPQEISNSASTASSAAAAAASTSASSSTSSSASGSLARPPTARATSTPSAPVSLHAARPVQLR